MTAKQSVGIRKFSLKDMQEVGEIFYDTSFLNWPSFRGNPTEDYRLYSFLGYYFYYEPGGIFLADDKASRQVVGYICGALNYKIYNTILWRKIYPRTVFLLGRNLRMANKESRRFIYDAFRSFIRGEFRLPADRRFLRKYPAHLHINILANYRRQGLGQKLLGAFEKYLRENNVSGVFLRTFCREKVSGGAHEFFSRQGFQEIFRNRLTLSAVSDAEKVFLVTMAKDLGV